MFPEWLQITGIERAVNDAIDWLVTSYGPAFEAMSDAILWLLIRVEDGLQVLPWWLVVAAVAVLAWHAARRLTLSAALAGSMVLIGALGYWDLAMQTLALMLTAMALSILIGLPTGIGLSRSTLARRIAAPVLDAMQTLPPFVYLIPALLLFGLGKVPAIIATLIYATPPVIRLTDLGLRHVDKDVAEAADAFGAGPVQKLWRVELPLALPSIMAGINQTTMMALSMVVLASMIGARGLGEEILRGIQTLDVGRGLTAGVAIVALAIVLDRITQAYGQRLEDMQTAADGSDAEGARL
ncbi:MAG: ABC transporter permease [Alphaproteobacteria bacterium]